VTEGLESQVRDEENMDRSLLATVFGKRGADSVGGRGFRVERRPERIRERSWMGRPDME